MLSHAIYRNADRVELRKFQKNRWNIRKKTRPLQVGLLLCLGAIMFIHAMYGSHSRTNSVVAPTRFNTRTTQFGINLLENEGNGEHAEGDGEGAHDEEWWQFEKDYFGLAIFLWIVIVMYCFIGLAVVCDEYFVASLEEISERLHLSDDVAGATFMASASSAPELFTNIADTFFGEGTGSNIGFGTIVGSAMFNILVIIAAAGIFSGGGLTVDWRPLARDCFFYLVSIALLLGFFNDGWVTWWENLLLVCGYASYILWMCRNEYLLWKICGGDEPEVHDGSKIDEVGTQHGPKMLELAIRARGISKAETEQIPASTGKRSAVTPIVPVITNTIPGQNEAPLFEDSDISAAAGHLEAPAAHGSEGGSRRTSASYSKPFAGRGPNLRFRAAVTAVIVARSTLPRMRDDLQERRTEWNTQAVAYPISPHSEAKTRWRAATHAVMAANYWSKLGTPKSEAQPKLDRIKSGKGYAGINSQDDSSDDDDPEIDLGVGGEKDELEDGRPRNMSNISEMSNIDPHPETQRKHSLEILDDDDDDDDDDPPGKFEQFINIISYPLVKLMSVTTPDCTKDKWKEWYMVTFLMSILWIGVLSYVMVEFATRIGLLAGISPIIMGVTILAAGTSVPDALASIVAARAGSAGMAVSNAIGSNVFDIEIGLGIPWFIACFAYGGVNPKTGNWNPARIKVFRDNLLIPVLMLFGTVIFTIGILKICKWRLSRFVGGCLFGVYILFIIYNVVVAET